MDSLGFAPLTIQPAMAHSDIEPQLKLRLKLLSDQIRHRFEKSLRLERAMLLLAPTALGTS